MKNIFALFLILFVAYSCMNKKIDYVTVSGKIENSTVNSIEVSRGEFSKKIPVDSERITDTLYIDENGFYNLNIGRDYISIYLEKGGNLSFSADANEIDKTIVFEGSIAAENNFLAWKALIKEKVLGSRNDGYKLDEDAFVETLDNYMDTLDSSLLNKSLSDVFVALEKKNLTFEKVYLLNNYERYHRYSTRDMEFKVSDNYTKNLEDLWAGIDFNNEVDYRNSQDFQNLLNPGYRSDVAEKIRNGGDYGDVLLNDYIPGIPNEYIRNSIMKGHYGVVLRADNNLDANYKRFMDLSTNEDHKKIYTEFYNKKKKITPGQPSPVFDYENYNGGTTSLNDLRGKYVYVDVWATWCGPCKAEIPYLQEVEKEYHNKNIAFVSISIDDKEDYQKWRDFVKEKDLGGIQLVADKDWDSDFVTGYQINGIPRFVLIDPDGNIVTSDAPRPSNKALKDLFSELKI